VKNANNYMQLTAESVTTFAKKPQKLRHFRRQLM
jgi:hypothetical protein